MAVALASGCAAEPGNGAGAGAPPGGRPPGTPPSGTPASGPPASGPPASGPPSSGASASGGVRSPGAGVGPAPGQPRRPVERPQQPGLVQPGAAAALGAYVEKVKRAHTARAAAARKWGLARTPLVAPPPPAEKPEITFRKGFEAGDPSLPPVFTTVPTKERIVFLTIDDGAEKDPELLRMMTELDVPYSAFLSDYLIKDDYGYFERMQARGVALQNHTLNHRYMPALSYAEQKHEICGQQEIIEKRYGKRPRLFRPPYGNYNRDTLRAAQSCGVKAVPLWSAEVFPDHMEWREWDRDLHPGDIVLTHFRGRGDWKGSMADMIRRALNTITAKGYAVARLEDYV
ncbi:polysaccharide deacetylase family protein [Streptomyces sp. SP18CS02]|nr:polysaccharide deacetylase family protein [Streptomyces sp. SP18CS02]MEE1756067.1 polysaccharide deacetylase family protein [Streptomyces sp. SP18CS02]